MLSFQRLNTLLRTERAPEPARPLMPVIVGAPRSGTTLLRLMLDAHPDLAIPPETGFLALGLKLKGSEAQRRETFLRAIVNFPAPAPCWPDFAIPEEAFRDALNEISPFTISEGYRAFYHLYAKRFGKTRWGDKTPSYCLALNSVRRVLPEARFVHLIRDGRDVALSLRKMWFSPGWDMETQAAYWRRYVSAGRAAGLGSADYLEVRYEDLILDTAATLKRICAHIDLSYDETMLSYHAGSLARLQEHQGRKGPDGVQLLDQDERLRQQQRATQPPDPSCVFSWKQTMTTCEREKFHLVAGDLLKDLGYEV